MVEDHNGLDLLNAFWLESEKERHLSCYKGLIRRARPYAFDDDATGLIQELAAGETINDKLAIYRRLARLPFDVIWIEIPYAARFRKRVELGVKAPWGEPEYGNQMPPDAPRRMGWLIERLTTTSWRATTVASFDGVETGSGRAVDTFAISHVLSTEGPMVTFHPLASDPDMRKAVRDLNKERLILQSRAWGFSTFDEAGNVVDGMPSHLYQSNAVDLAASWEPIIARQAKTEREKRAKIAEHLKQSISELAGDLRFIVAALATINEVPTVMETFRADGRVRVAGGIKPYMVNRIVRIGIPKTRGRVRKILAMLRLAERAMRRHEVSGHWKTVRTKGGKELRWVEDYLRGDAELGFVRQIREVEGE